MWLRRALGCRSLPRPAPRARRLNPAAGGNELPAPAREIGTRPDSASGTPRGRVTSSPDLMSAGRGCCTLGQRATLDGAGRAVRHSGFESPPSPTEASGEGAASWRERFESSARPAPVPTCSGGARP